MRENVEGLRVWQEDEGILIGGRDKGRVGFRQELPSDSAPLSAETIDEKSDLCLLCFDEPACGDCPEFEKVEAVGLGIWCEYASPDNRARSRSSSDAASCTSSTTASSAATQLLSSPFGANGHVTCEPSMNVHDTVRAGTSKTTSVMSALCQAALSMAWMFCGASTPNPSSCISSIMFACARHAGGHSTFASWVGSGRVRVKRMFGEGWTGKMRMSIFAD